MLIILRLLLSPAMIVLAFTLDEQPGWLLACMTVALVSDIFDGIIARKLGVATPLLRKFDSIADLLFWATSLTCAFLLQPEIIVDNGLFIGVLLLGEIGIHLLSFGKFQKPPANHAYLSKLWALTVWVSLSLIIGWGFAGWPFLVMFGLGVLSYLDNFLILLVLPNWKSDTSSVLSAIKVRQSFNRR